MSSFSPRLLHLERYLILASLLVLAALAWVLLTWQSSMMGMSSQGMGLTMGLSALLFLAIWFVMMVAMMFPASAPMILTFSNIYASRYQHRHPFVPTWIFIGAYLLIWSLCGLIAYPLALFAQQLATSFPWLMENAARLGGGILLFAGVYQLSPLKDLCLAKCRTPLQFILTSWHDGYGGAFRMGLEHGFYCLGCCWLLFVMLFPLGIMNLGVMALVSALIFAEKALPGGRLLSKVAGAGLVAYGLLVIFLPALLPQMM